MLVEHIIPLGFYTQLHSPPQTFEERPLKELYLILSERSRYTQFEILPGGQGAILREADGRACEIHSDRVVIKEQPTQRTFEEYVEGVIPTLAEIKRRLGIPVWMLQQTNLRFLLPFDMAVQPALRDHLYNISDSALERFGRPVLGLCLRIEFPPLPEDPTQLQLRIEPYFREPRRLYLELNSRFLQPIQNPEDLRARLMSAYDFLRDRSVSFLQEVFNRAEG